MGALLIFATAIVISALIHFRDRSPSRCDSTREDCELQVLQRSGDGEPLLSVVKANLRPDRVVESEATLLESSPLPPFVSPDQVREGIVVLRGESISPFQVVTLVGISLAMSDRAEAVLVRSVGMSEEGAYNVRESALEQLASNELRGELFLENICANADFYASSAMELAEKVIEYDTETDRLQKVRLQQLSEDLSPSDFNKLLTYSMSRAQTMSVMRADMRVFATQGLLDARAYVRDICGSQV